MHHANAPHAVTRHFKSIAYSGVSWSRRPQPRGHPEIRPVTGHRSDRDRQPTSRTHTAHLTSAKMSQAHFGLKCGSQQGIRDKSMNQNIPTLQAITGLRSPPYTRYLLVPNRIPGVYGQTDSKLSKYRDSESVSTYKTANISRLLFSGREPRPSPPEAKSQIWWWAVPGSSRGGWEFEAAETRPWLAGRYRPSPHPSANCPVRLARSVVVPARSPGFWPYRCGPRRRRWTAWSPRAVAVRCRSRCRCPVE